MDRPAQQVSVTSAGADEDVLLTDDASTGQLLLDGARTGEFSFLAPSGGLTIDAAGSRLRVTDLDLGAAAIVVNGATSVTVAGRVRAGTITLNANASTDVTDGAVVDSAGGLTITVSAHQDAQLDSAERAAQAANAVAVLHIGAATIRARDILLISQTEVSTIVAVTIDGSVPGDPAGSLATSRQSSAAALLIGSNADIEALDVVTACAVATSLQIVGAQSTSSGVATGASSAAAALDVTAALRVTAALDVAGGARIVAGGDITLASLVRNLQLVDIAVGRTGSASPEPAGRTDSIGTADAPTQSSAVGDAHAAASTVLATGALVDGDRVTIGSRAVTDIILSSSNRNADGANGVAGAAVLSSVDSSSLTEVDGTVRARAALLIGADSTIDNNQTAADAMSTAATVDGLDIGALPGLPAFAGSLAGLLGTGTFGVAGAAVLVTSRNGAVAAIGSNALVSSAGDLWLESRAEDNLTSSSTATVNRPEYAGQSGALVAGTAELATHRNESTARIGDGATVDAGGSISEHADAVVRAPSSPDINNSRAPPWLALPSASRAPR